MSTNASPIDAYPSEKARTLARYLREEAEAAGGELYVKSKFITDDLDLSAKEIGAVMVQLQGTVPDLEIEKWSYTSATTWRIVTDT